MRDFQKKNTVVVFDLDDTLYDEYDYQTSGIRAVAEELKNLYDKDLIQTLLHWRDQGVKDIFGKVCKVLQLPIEVKRSLVWIYRLHDPDIALHDDVREALVAIQRMVKRIMILTDGRSISQRKKLKALCLNDIEVYISEEYSSEKPKPERFRIIMNSCFADKYYYIGDNPKKDFLAPNALGWITVGIRNNNALHEQNVDGSETMSSPSIWIKSIREIVELLC